MRSVDVDDGWSATNSVYPLHRKRDRNVTGCLTERFE